jgi:hypothetical protein
MPATPDHNHVHASRKPRGSYALNALLFWLMLTAGSLSMAACLILPVWLEYQATGRLVARAEQRNEALRLERDARELQIAHHEFDPEYNERFVRQEFNLRRADRVTIVLDPPPGQPADSPVAAPEDPPRSQADELAEMIETAARRNPIVSLFALPQTRPVVMVLSGILLFGSVLLLRSPMAG